MLIGYKETASIKINCAKYAFALLPFCRRKYQNIPMTGQTPYKISHVVFARIAIPSAAPAAVAAIHFVEFSHFQNVYAAASPNAAAAQSFVINSPCARTFGSKHQSAAARRPALLLRYNSVAQRKLTTAPMMLNGIQAHR